MPKGPPVHEIFNPPAKKDLGFHYEKKESKIQTQLNAKKSLAPLPPMKKFGGYKPKILGGTDDFVSISSNNNRHHSPDPPVEKRRPAPKPIPVLTQPKPFIIGDKNTPMVLSTVSDNAMGDQSLNLNNRLDEMHIYEEPPMYNKRNSDDMGEVNNNDMNNIDNNMSPYYIGELNNNNNNSTNAFRNAAESDFNTHHAHSLDSTSNSEAFTAGNDVENLIDKTRLKKDPTAFATDNPIFSHMDSITTDTDGSRIEIENGHGNVNENESETEIEPDGLFIPAPDYEEDERTMEFDEEDPDDLAEERRQAQVQKQQRLQHLQQGDNGTRMKIYDGEDLSKYLSDDEDDFRENEENARTMPVRLNQKHSLFKSNPNNTTGKRKTYSKNKAPKFNSVRNFSLADSKYATSSKASGKTLNGVGKGGSGGGSSSGDYESFLSTSQQGEGYETFLVSKHGVGMGTSSPGKPQMNGKQHGDGLWKKLTVRLKNKRQKNGYDMQEQF